MDPGVMIVAIVAIGCTYELLKRFVERRPPANQKELLGEIRALRDEIRQLRQENHGIILSLDSSLQRVDGRVDRLELRAGGEGGPDRACRLKKPCRLLTLLDLQANARYTPLTGLGLQVVRRQGEADGTF